MDIETTQRILQSIEYVSERVDRHFDSSKLVVEAFLEGLYLGLESAGVLDQKYYEEQTEVYLRNGWNGGALGPTPQIVENSKDDQEATKTILDIELQIWRGVVKRIQKSSNES